MTPKMVHSDTDLAIHIIGFIQKILIFLFD